MWTVTLKTCLLVLIVGSSASTWLVSQGCGFLWALQGNTMGPCPYLPHLSVVWKQSPQTLFSKQKHYSTFLKHPTVTVTRGRWFVPGLHMIPSVLHYHIVVELSPPYWVFPNLTQPEEWTFMSSWSRGIAKICSAASWKVSIWVLYDILSTVTGIHHSMVMTKSEHAILVAQLLS